MKMYFWARNFENVIFERAILRKDFQKFEKATINYIFPDTLFKLKYKSKYAFLYFVESLICHGTFVCVMVYSEYQTLAGFERTF